MSGQTKDKAAGKGTYVRLSPDERARLEAMAGAEYRTLSDQLRFLIFKSLGQEAA